MNCKPYMEKVKALNLKNMKEALVNDSGDQREMDNIWNTLRHMACMGFISSGTWKKFYEQCAGWYIAPGEDCVRDSNGASREGTIVWEYTSGAVYKA